MNTLVWFRNDLRVTDNKALFHACKNPTKQIIAIFLSTPKQWKQHNLAARQVAFIYENLLKLQQSLSDLGISLVHKQCIDFQDSLKVLKKFCQIMQIKELFYNRQYELNELTRDQTLHKILGDQIIIHQFDDSVLFTPGTILTKNHEMYKVFTPFYNQCMKQLNQIKVSCLPIPEIRYNNILLANNHPIQHIIPKYFNYTQVSCFNYNYCPPGENSALSKLKNFCHCEINAYAKIRDIPALHGTSFLSPYLTIGVISPRQCLDNLKNANVNYQYGSALVWVKELIWREFYRHLIVAYPELCKSQPFIKWTDQIPWNNDPKLLFSWQNGITGYPLVDAGMRQLNSTGWINNRLRMVTASFLVKHLLIDWRIGESYFMSKLLDGDFASNNGGWQWIASTGVNAMPYFRMFNPIMQTKKFDPYGTFIRRWVPEMKNVPNEHLNDSQKWAKLQQCANALKYPLPIVDYVDAGNQTLHLFKQTFKKFNA